MHVTIKHHKLPFPCTLTMSSFSENPSSSSAWRIEGPPGVSSSWPLADRMKPTSSKANED